MAKKKNRHQQQQHLSPEKLVRTKARTLPLGDCYISEGFEQAGEANIVVSRLHQGGKVTIGYYLVDIFCLGVKKSGYQVRLGESEWEDYKEYLKQQGMRLCTYEEAHNWIYGAIAFAEEAGISPDKTFDLTQYILEEDTDEIPLIDYHFGKDGEHYLIANSPFEASIYLPLLQEHLGEGNFMYSIADNDDFDDKMDDDFDAGEMPAK